MTTALTDGEQPALRVLVFSLCTYESVAISTRRVPTLSHLIGRLPLPVKIAAAGLLVGGLVDHLFTRRFIR